jgi:isopenicillin N synthase-like dioxygenase
MSARAAGLPVIDVSALIRNAAAAEEVAAGIGKACREHGFFYISGHGIDEDLQHRLVTLSQQFFEQPLQTKMQIRMQLGGRAWRGFFPVGDELTSGKPDQKEGLYFGSELPVSHPKVQAGVPLHGANLFPDIPRFRETVLEYMQALTELGHNLMTGMALSLGLTADYFRQRFTEEPITLFRIFHYPTVENRDASWGVGEHTDYGILTILKQDDVGGLQVKSKGSWIEAPPIPGTFVCNIGDMLDRMTGGLYRSTPHRVRNPLPAELPIDPTRGRYSFPFFFDPNWDTEVTPIFPDRPISDDQQERWDGTSLHKLHGTYGEYLLGKVSKVFPELGREQLSRNP